MQQQDGVSTYITFVSEINQHPPIVLALIPTTSGVETDGCNTSNETTLYKVMMHACQLVELYGCILYAQGDIQRVTGHCFDSYST